MCLKEKSSICRWIKNLIQTSAIAHTFLFYAFSNKLPFFVLINIHNKYFNHLANTQKYYSISTTKQFYSVLISKKILMIKDRNVEVCFTRNELFVVIL